MRHAIPPRLASFVGLTIVILSVAGAAAAPPQSKKLSDAHEAAKWRTRRIIMNNDGNDFNRLGPSVEVTPETFLAQRTTPLLGSHVDSIFYCTGVFNLYTHRSEETELHASPKSAARNVHKLLDKGTDSLEVMTRFCHDNNIEVFWSMRMNDSHDSSKDHADIFCQWKKDHPDWLVGKRNVKYPYGHGRWSSVDYNHAEVRDKVFRIFEDVCTRYDIDGIELDFFRHPVIFKEQMTGKPITDAQRRLMTQLIRRIRKMTQEVAAGRGRPMLVAVRVPDSVAYCRALGLDLETWLDEGLVDIVINGCYFRFNEWDYLVGLGKKHDVPVYACFESRRIERDTKETEGPTSLEVWRGEAYQAWKAGVNGIYTFNRFNPRDPIFRELGDPKLLETLNRRDQSVLSNPKLGFKPGRFVKGGERLVGQRK